MDLKEKVKSLPEVPGVYKMKDFSGNIIYVGKSKNLRSRVGQYFQSSRNHAPKIVKMVQGIRDFDYITTDTELEALLLECSLIKKIQPMFNSQMKNHKKYVYLRVTINEEYPRIVVADETMEDGSLYFGPYASRSSAERAADAIKNNFKIGNCTGSSKNGSGCLNYQIGLCLGACAEPELKAEYMNRLNSVIAFLNGKDYSIIDEITKKMMEASERLDFDKAAKYRDDINLLKHLVNRQRVVSFAQRKRNIIAAEYIDEGTLKIFLLSNSSLLYEEKIEVSSVSMEFFKNHLKEIATIYFKPDGLKKSNKVDKEDIDQSQIVFSYLQNNKDCVYVLIPDSWLREKNGEKLDKGLNKFVIKVIE